MQIPTSKALAHIAEIFEETAESIVPERKLDSMNAWDSMGILTFIAELDEKYDVILSTDEIQKLTTIQDILATLNNHGLEIVD